LCKGRKFPAKRQTSLFQFLFFNQLESLRTKANHTGAARGRSARHRVLKTGTPKKGNWNSGKRKLELRKYAVESPMKSGKQPQRDDAGTQRI
jgi:hypothetical protein